MEYGNDLDYRHPLYEANLGRWNYYRALILVALIIGTLLLVCYASIYLRMTHAGNQYANRLDYTALDNMTKLTVDTYDHSCFAQHQSRTFGNLVEDLSITRFMEDVDFNGKDLDDFKRSQ